ncbi:Endonuclease/exonuclease/phosphatase [Blastocladiella britannica]|nr:Endonuclease/exonuclease/phosphatase [Blastocladiella britannica]
MPAPTLPAAHPADAFAVSIYTPVHYDFSQVEYVAPFLEQYPGSKVFIYKWNGIRDKMHEYYLKSQEYERASLGVYDFSLKQIVRCIVEEPVNRKVVFLLTTSMAYLFGQFQRDLLKAIKDALNAVADRMETEGVRDGNVDVILRGKALRDKVWGVSVIGHCMYGCMSCKGNDHKVPVYYTRYFKGNIPYTRQSVAQQFGIDLASPIPAAGTGPIPVLCAPSTGETTLLQHRPILEYLKQLQDAGHYKFVWKFHPMVYNHGAYDAACDTDQTELANVKWIFANFAVTREDEPCLLPFIEAFPLVFCDLHSSVPFIASYFSPKAIVCYWNDADYEVPAGRDPEFLKNLHVFQHLDQLPAIFASGKMPDARGDIAFFWQQYGQVDGNEVGRFASLAEWPLVTDVAQSTIGVHATVDIKPAFRRVMAETARRWEATYRDVLQRKDMPEDENGVEDIRQAMGLFGNTDLEGNDSESSSKIDAGAAGAAAEATGKPTVSIMTFNLWWGLEGAYRAKLLAGASPDLKRNPSAPLTDIPAAESQRTLVDHGARAILAAGADVVGCQETGTLFKSDNDAQNERDTDLGKLGDRDNIIFALADRLRALSGDTRWTAIDQGILTPGKGSRHPWGMVSRLPVISRSPSGFGVQVRVPGGAPVWVFNTHLPYKPYGPYQVQRPHDIPYEGAPALSTAAAVVESSALARGAQVDALLADIDGATQGQAAPVFLTGDFNEPSHLDWTARAAISGDHALPVAWPATRRMAAAGFSDAYRVTHPDPALDPGYSWATLGEELQSGKGDETGWRTHGDGARDVHDRIDFVHYKGRGVRVVNARVVGSARSLGKNSDLVQEGVVQVGIDNAQWGSDHRAVVARFELGSA